MKWIPIAFSLLAALWFAACREAPSDDSITQTPTPAPASLDPVRVVDGVTIVEMTANDQMKYNVESFVVPAGSTVRLTLRNIGKMPKAAMGHNVVILRAGADANAFAAAAASARDNDYIPSELADEILAASQLLGPGEQDTIEFTAPDEPGDYVYLCSFPAHMFAGMRGVITVE